MKTFNQFQENVATSILKSKPAQALIGKTPAGRFVRSLGLPDKVADIGIPFTKRKLGTNKVTQALNIPYKAGTDSMFMGPLAPVTFMGSLATRAFGPGLSKLGQAREKARLETRKNMLSALKKSGDKNSQFNVDRYMSNFKNVDGKSLYPSLIPKI